MTLEEGCDAISKIYPVHSAFPFVIDKKKENKTVMISEGGKSKVKEAQIKQMLL